MRRITCSILLLLLVLASAAFGAYNPQNDANCQAWWRMESGAITTDSSGEGNTLTNNDSTATSATCKEGSASMVADGAADYLSILDNALSTDFPLKVGDTNKDLSICFWVRFDTMPANYASESVWSKYNPAGDLRSLNILIYNTETIQQFEVHCGHTSGTAAEAIKMEVDTSTAVWYHVAFTHKGSDSSYRLRVWDDNAQAQLGTDITGTLSNTLSVRAAQVTIGCRSDPDLYMDGLIDDLLVFDDVLTVGEIDQIRAQTYDPSADTETCHLNALNYNSGVVWSNESNAYTEDDDYASTNDMTAPDVYAGGNFQGPSHTPLTLTEFKIRFFDINSEHDDDTFVLEFWDDDAEESVTLETFNSGNPLPTSLTTKDYTSTVQSRFNSAGNKADFLAYLKVDLYLSTVSGDADDINWGLAWSKFIYEYEDAEGGQPPPWVMEQEVILP